jgi:tetratricopeptide (TPR) repeat protein
MDETTQGFQARLQRLHDIGYDSPEWPAQLKDLHRDAAEAGRGLSRVSEEGAWLARFLEILEKLPGARELGLGRKVPWHRDGMPPETALFFGRLDEIAELDAWLARPSERIVVIDGAGGYGKTQLVNRWIRRLKEGDQAEQARGGGPEAVFCWCFYTTPGRVPTLLPEFLTQAVRFFREVTGTTEQVAREERHELLARMTTSGHYLVVLDGLEALQKRHLSSTDEPEEDSDLPPGSFRKRYKQMGLFLEAVAAGAGGKVAITSRQFPAVLKELLERGAIRRMKIPKIDASSGSEILRQLGVRGSEKELEGIVDSLAGHPLAISLAGSALAWNHSGVASRFHQLRRGELVESTPESKIEAEIVDSYRKWLGAGPQMELLRLVGFFSKRLIPREDLTVLLRHRSLRELMPNLWQEAGQGGVDGEGPDWAKLNGVLRVLNQSNLLLHSGDDEGPHPPEEVFDVHPLLRNYYREELRALAGGRHWQEGHQALFDHFRKKVQGRAETEIDALVLYEAIGYACEAGKYKEAFCIYNERIHHNQSDGLRNTWHALHRLGLYAADLGATGWFFSNPWEQLSEAVERQLTVIETSLLRYAVAHCLRTLGFESEAGHPLGASFKALERQGGRYVDKAILKGEECERHLIRGKFEKARQSAERSLHYAEMSEDDRQILSKYGLLGEVYLQMGNWPKARKSFDKVRKLHARMAGDVGASAPRPIGGLTGFRLGDFLLCRAEISLGGWDPAKEHLKKEYVDKERAGADLEWVIAEVDRFLAGPAEAVSRQDGVLHAFLRERARAIKNILLVPRSDPEIQIEIDRALRGLYAEFQSYARGDVPRLLVKRSKVLRRLRQIGVDEADGDDPFVVAMDCLDEAADVAAYGQMELFEADIELERAKVFFARSVHPDLKFGPAEDSRRLASDCWEQASQLIHKLGYWKRLPELMSLKTHLDGQ